MSTKALVREAVESGNGESFRVLRKSDDYRVSLGVRLETTRPTFFFEVLVYLCLPSSGIQLARLEAKLRLIEELSNRGYFTELRGWRLRLLRSCAVPEKVGIRRDERHVDGRRNSRKDGLTSVGKTAGVGAGGYPLGERAVPSLPVPDWLYHSSQSPLAN